MKEKKIAIGYKGRIICTVLSFEDKTQEHPYQVWVTFSNMEWEKTSKYKTQTYRDSEYESYGEREAKRDYRTAFKQVNDEVFVCSGMREPDLWLHFKQVNDEVFVCSGMREPDLWLQECYEKVFGKNEVSGS